MLHTAAQATTQSINSIHVATNLLQCLYKRSVSIEGYKRLSTTAGRQLTGRLDILAHHGLALEIAANPLP